MKKQINIYFLLIALGLILFSHTASSQAPQAIPYQAVARNASGNLLVSQSISLRFTIRDLTVGGTIVYRETQNVTTNNLGLFSVHLGQGTPITGSLAAVNWANGSKFLQVELDPTGGAAYTDMGTTKLMSVPYALNAGTSSDNKWVQSGNNISNSNTGNVGIGTSIPTNKLSVTGNVDISGNVGIGTSNPSQQLHTTGGVRHQSLSGSGARAVMADASGNLFTQSQIPSSTTSAAGGNQIIPNFGCASGSGLTSTITLSGLPSSFNPTLISVTVNINASYSSDYVLFLIAPSGQVLRLAQNAGGGGGGFVNTTFTDAASVSINSGSTPFNGSFKPSGGLNSSCFVTPTVNTFGDFGGGMMNPNGIWTLKIFDNIFFDTGFFADWSVNVSAYSDPPVSNYVVKWNGSALSSISSIYDNGNVGIGTNNPSKKLTVTGDILVNGCAMGRGNNSVVSNIALGTNSLNVNSTGGNNVGIGEDALILNTTGHSNTGLGNYALENNVGGNSITGIGYGTNVGNSNLVNATALGARAMVSQSNSLVLGSINGINGATASAFVGIGTATPSAPLHVAGPGITTATLARTYFNVGLPLTSNTSPSGNVLVRADGWIWASSGGFISTSDQRIKNKLSTTNNQKDLDDLNKIEITNYKYIDEIANGHRLHKKVIAQQLNSVYPLAVDTNQGIIPNVFEIAKSSSIQNDMTIVETSKAHDFKTGDEVKLILEKSGEKIVNVIVIDANTFSVNEKINDKIFVYGKKVNDLLIVDYDALTTLNISATQALSNENNILKKEIEMLKRQLHQSEISSQQKMAILESKINLLLTSNASASK